MSLAIPGRKAAATWCDVLAGPGNEHLRPSLVRHRKLWGSQSKVLMTSGRAWIFATHELDRVPAISAADAGGFRVLLKHGYMYQTRTKCSVGGLPTALPTRPFMNDIDL